MDGPVRIIGIDTGLLGTIDAEQGAWLREVSKGPLPRSSSPARLYVDGEHHPCPIEGGGTVDDLVRDPDHRYLAAIGGDIHNYQRYPVQVDGRTIQYVVSGGGGALVRATHAIPASPSRTSPSRVRCYPLRGDSLAFYSRLYGHRLRLRRLFTLSEAEATAVVAERLGIPPTRTQGPPARVTRRTRLIATLLGAGSHPRTHLALPPARAKVYSQLFSPSSATYSPPFFKCFLRLDVTPEAVRLRCFAATGKRAQELDPAGRGRSRHSADLNAWGPGRCPARPPVRLPAPPRDPGHWDCATIDLEQAAELPAVGLALVVQGKTPRFLRGDAGARPARRSAQPRLRLLPEAGLLDRRGTTARAETSRAAGRQCRRRVLTR